MPKVLVPNQPVFVYTYTPSVINMRGSVVNMKNKVASLYVHGMVFTGTQAGLSLPVVWTGISHKGRIFIYGFHINGGTLFDSSRFRVPLLVTVWKMVLGYVNVIANCHALRHSANVHAELSPTSAHEAGVSYTVDMDITEREAFTAHWNIGSTEGRRYVTSVARKETIDHQHKILANPVDSKILGKDYMIRLRPVMNLIENLHKLSAALTEPNITGRHRLGVSLVVKTIYGTHKLVVYLVNSTFKGVHKIAVWLRSITHLRYKMTTQVSNPNLIRTHKLSVSVLRAVLLSSHRFIARIVNNRIQGLHKLSVHLSPKEIKKILGLIWYIVGHKLEQTVKGFTKLVKGETNKVSTLRLSQRATTQDARKVDYTAHKTKRSLVVSATAAEPLKNRLTWIAINSISRRMYAFLSFTSHSVETDILNNIIQIKLLREQIEKAKLVLTAEYVDVPVDLNIDVIPGIATRYVRFRPMNVPQLRWLNVLITVNHSEVLAYLDFIAENYIQNVNVEVDIFTPEHIALLQWYLHGGCISNEGNSNEVVFDLGEPDDGSDEGGYLPVTPSRQWSGGYVEDQFKGVGYTPTSDSTGYASPNVSGWVKGSKMYWGSVGEPFQGDA